MVIRTTGTIERWKDGYAETYRIDLTHDIDTLGLAGLIDRQSKLLLAKIKAGETEKERREET